MMPKGLICVLQSHGLVLFSQSARKVVVSFHLKGFTKLATHAIHIHEYGDLSQGCTSLGGHWNPTNKPHGEHVGDLMYNFTADEQGTYQGSLVLNNVDLTELLGRSIVIHQEQDDLGIYGNIDYASCSNHQLNVLCKRLGYTGLINRYEQILKLEQESLLTGNAGKRLDCGVIGRRGLDKNN